MGKEFSFNGEPVERERWRWSVEYTDGTHLDQFDEETGLFHQIAEIDQDRIEVFKMECDGLPEFRIFWEPGMKLIHHYVNTVLNHGTDEEMHLRQYVFGFERDEKKTVIVINPDDSPSLTDKV